MLVAHVDGAGEGSSHAKACPEVDAVGPMEPQAAMVATLASANAETIAILRRLDIAVTIARATVVVGVLVPAVVLRDPRR